MAGHSGNFCHISVVNRFIELFDMNRIPVLVENHEFTNEDWLVRLIHQEIPLVTRLQEEAEVAQLSY